SLGLLGALSNWPMDIVAPNLASSPVYSTHAIRRFLLPLLLLCSKIPRTYQYATKKFSLSIFFSEDFELTLFIANVKHQRNLIGICAVSEVIRNS
ncbi:MAG: hypothetical protein AAF892_07470, partial [Cyanobacteria bacterium P01_D01_bin.71]